MSHLLPFETWGRPCVVAVNSWAGRAEIKAIALRETPKKWRVRFEEDALCFRKGEERLVPKGAVRLLEEPRDAG